MAYPSDRFVNSSNFFDSIPKAIPVIIDRNPTHLENDGFLLCADADSSSQQVSD